MATAAGRLPGSAMVDRRTFRAMGTEVELLVVGAREIGALDGAAEFVASLDARWSRFRPGSEVSLLNAADGQPVHLPPDTFALVEAAVDAWRRTGGRFDPTILRALNAAGYDRSFESLAVAGLDGTREPVAVPGCAGIALQRDTGLVILPPGVTLDLGGIAKGYAADRAAVSLLAAGAAGAVANLGGDLRAVGVAPDGGPWAVGIEDPHQPGRDVAVLMLGHGAVATSSRIRRRWVRGGRTFHHLIDPATGAPTGGPVDAAVVVAGDAMWAEVLAKAALIAGPDEGPALLKDFGVTGLLILDSGDVLPCPGIEAFLR